MLETRQRIVHLLCFTVIAITVVGYFVGLQSPNSQLKTENRTPKTKHNTDQERRSGVLPATHYSEMPEQTAARNNHTRLASLKSAVDPLAEFTISAEEKHAALDQRESNRAFNGAPPTIPHPIEQRSDAACVACHREGARSNSLRIPRMSHAFLTNCTQCHVENNPRHMTPVEFRANDFVGLQAPDEGPRAFKGGPPQIPHATWMRSDCLSCHGYTGRQGIRTTHPWRASCQQCHIPSAAMDQTLLAAEPQFLPGPQIKR